MFQDLRYAVRSLRNEPAFATAVIVTLALGIGANASIFSIADAVLLKTVPVARPHELYFLAHGTGERPSISSTYPLFERYRSLQDAFSGVTAYNVREFKVSTESGPEAVPGQYVAPNYHSVLGVQLVLGRSFAAEADAAGESTLTAVISERYWSRAFGRDTSVLGRTLTVNGKAVTIVGVTAAGFHGLRPGTQFDITLPLAAREIDDPGFFERHDTWTGLNIVARLRGDVTATQTLARADTVFQQYMSGPEHAWTRREKQTADSFRIARLVPAGRGTGALRGQYEWALRVLLAMVGLVLLIACANVAHLMLARGSSRAKEVAIRISLGATRGSLIRRFLTESLLLAFCGGTVGLLCSGWLAAAIVSLLGGGQFPITVSVELDGRLLAFTVFVSLLTAGLVGTLPALRASAPDVTPALKAGESGWTPRRLGTGAVLTIAQVALAVLLLAASSALVRSLAGLKSQDPGFSSKNVLLFYVTAATQHDLLAIQAMAERLQALPGVRAVSFSTTSPLATNEESRPIRVPGTTPPGQQVAVFTNRVTPQYFSTFGISLLRGREITPQDSSNAPKIAVISETMARTVFAGADPIGRTFVFASTPNEPVTVVGIARDVRQQSLHRAAPALVYLPLAQAEDQEQQLTAAIQTGERPRALEREARAAVAAYDRDLLISYMRTLEQQVATSLAPERVMAWLSSGFGLVALLLACVGLYGLLAYNVTRRTREIGIRIALGAAPAAILRQTLRDALLLCTIGLALGLAATLAVAPAIGAFVFGVSPRDPITLLLSTIALVSTAALAAYVPARRAARIDPILALKAD